MQLPAEGVTWDPRKRKHVVVLVLDPDEADNFAYALGPHDAGAVQILGWAETARARDENTAWVPVGVPDEV